MSDQLTVKQLESLAIRFVICRKEPRFPREAVIHDKHYNWDTLDIESNDQTICMEESIVAVTEV